MAKKTKKPAAVPPKGARVPSAFQSREAEGRTSPGAAVHTPSGKGKSVPRKG